LANITVAIAENHTLFLRLMKHFINNMQGMEVIIEAENGKELIDKIKQRKPHVVLMDLKMPEMNGYEATKYLCANNFDIRVIILSMYDEEYNIRTLIKAGACGYLVKNTKPKEVEKAIRTVMKKGYYFNDSIHKAIYNGSHATSYTQNDSIILTDRQSDVLELISDGLTSSNIAKKLFISTKTVQEHRKNLLEKFKVKNTAQLVNIATKKGFVSFD